MDFSWSIFVDLGIISAALLLATLVRARVRFFQRYLIPNALTAGFILLPMYNFVFPRLGMTPIGLGELAYHLLSISFVAMALRPSPPYGRKGDGRIFAFSISVIAQYALQAAIGLGATFVFIVTIMPELFHSFGFLLPLGFALGPGQAFAIGEGWSAFGIQGAGSIGLTFAAIGFVLSCFGGVFIINYGIKKNWLAPEFIDKLTSSRVKTGVYGRSEALPVGANLTTESEAIDSMSFNTAVVLTVYLFSYLFLRFLGWALAFVGPLGTDLAVNLWGISFIFATMIAIVVKQVFKGLRIEYVLDAKTLSRVSGLAVDVMVTSAIAAISLVVVSRYWLPIVALSVLGGVVTFVSVPWMCSRIFHDHPFHRMLVVYGVSTGTLSTGLALLRVIDPEFETPVATDYTYASGLTFLLVIPFILSINLPVTAYTTGNMVFFWAAMGVSIAYLVFVLVAYIVIARRNAFRSTGRVWLPEGPQTR